MAARGSHFPSAVLQLATAQVCHDIGFEAAQEEASHTLADVAATFIEHLGRYAVDNANFCGRTDVCMDDVALALRKLGTSGPQLSDYMKRTDCPFARTAPPRFPVPRTSHHLVHADRENCQLPAHVPGHLPPFPTLDEAEDTQDKDAEAQAANGDAGAGAAAKQEETEQERQLEQAFSAAGQQLLHNTPFVPLPVPFAHSPALLPRRLKRASGWDEWEAQLLERPRIPPHYICPNSAKATSPPYRDKRPASPPAQTRPSKTQRAHARVPHQVPSTNGQGPSSKQHKQPPPDEARAPLPVVRLPQQVAPPAAQPENHSLLEDKDTVVVPTPHHRPPATTQSQHTSPKQAPPQTQPQTQVPSQTQTIPQAQAPASQHAAAVVPQQAQPAAAQAQTLQQSPPKQPAAQLMPQSQQQQPPQRPTSPKSSAPKNRLPAAPTSTSLKRPISPKQPRAVSPKQSGQLFVPMIPSANSAPKQPAKPAASAAAAAPPVKSEPPPAATPSSPDDFDAMPIAFGDGAKKKHKKKRKIEAEQPPPQQAPPQMTLPKLRIAFGGGSAAIVPSADALPTAAAAAAPTMTTPAVKKQPGKKSSAEKKTTTKSTTKAGASGTNNNKPTTKQPQQATDGTGQETYCKCKTTNTDGNFICCDLCSQWYHPECVGTSMDIPSFICERCDALLTGDDRKAITKVLGNIKKSPLSYWFRNPVTEDIAPGYGVYVKTPMDLGLLSRKVKTYHLRSHFFHDLGLLEFNARKYNGPKPTRDDPNWYKDHPTEMAERLVEEVRNKLRPRFPPVTQ